jgi:dienelactone hydrolase
MGAHTARRRLPTAALAVALLLLAAACSGAPRSAAAPGDRTRPVPVSAQVYQPSGPGPFPALVLLHGSTGVLPYHHDWARWLAREGYVALVVDSFGPRGVTRDGGALTGERVGDAFGALAFARSLPFVDGGRVGAMGWSLGAGVALLAGGELFAGRAPPPGTFAVVVAFYPACAHTDASELMAPALLLLGDADTWTPAERCVQTAHALLARGHPVEWTVYAGATHGFDFGRGGASPAPINVGGHELRHDAGATADAEQRVREFLGRHLRAPARPR